VLDTPFYLDYDLSSYQKASDVILCNIFF